MTVKNIFVFALAMVAITAVMRTVVYAFDLSREQAGWLNAATGCAIVLGFLLWRRK